MNDRWAVSVTNGDREKLTNSWRSDVDPSAGTIEYGVRAVSATTAVASWVAGTVGGTSAWSSTTRRVEHLTPTIGASGAGIVLTAGTNYELWGKLTLSSEVIVRRCGVISAT